MKLRTLWPLFLLSSAATAQTTVPTSAPSMDRALWQTMQQVDAAANVQSLRGEFRQEKFTPLMKKPLVSNGTIVARGAVAVWSTQAAEPTHMLVNDREIQIYYPTQSAEEIYPIVGKLGAMASTPLPRLDTLRTFFTFTQISPHDLDPNADDAGSLALQLEPIDEQLREHVRQVRVLLDRSSGLVKIAETTDPDGERTVLSFSNVKVNVPLKAEDLKLDIPPGTRVEHPLGGGGGGIDYGTSR